MTNYTVTSGNPSIGLTLDGGDQLQVESTAVAEYTTVNSGLRECSIQWSAAWAPPRAAAWWPCMQAARLPEPR